MRIQLLDNINKTTIVGIEKTEKDFLIAKLSYLHGVLAIEKLEKRTKEDNVKPLYMEDHAIATAVDANDVLVRQLNLKLTKRKDVDAVVPFQSEPLIPYPSENAVLQWSSVSQENGTEVTVLAVRKDHLAQHLAKWRQWQIEPELVVATPTALLEFARRFAPSEELLFWVHLEEKETTCILLQGSNLIAAKAIPKLLNAASEDELRLEISRTLFSMAKQIKGETVREVGFSGSKLTDSPIPTILCRALNIQRKDYTIPPDISANTQELETFALPIGTALCGLPKNLTNQNFRVGELAYPNPWKRLRDPLVAYMGLCAAFALAFYLFGASYNSYELAKVRQDYAQFLLLINKPYAEVESKVSVDGEIPPVEALTVPQMQERLAFLEKESKAIPITYPFVPGVPRVSDVLAWLSTHPKIIGLSDGNEKNPEALKLESLSYSMIKRPDTTKKNERYQVKVDLEFTSPTPKAAREFHDALIAPNNIVDPKSEIKWSTNRGKYSTSFMLKDRTLYTGS